MAVSIGKKVYVLLSDNKIIGIWTNLKYLCNYMIASGTQFSSYSKLAKDIAEMRKTGNETPQLIIQTKAGKEYQIQVETLKGFD